ncbi:MAG: hypothetical protein JEZ06_08710 [Anaerolineaceae bacterium]|nr:hypothetical protein [Anaerolineaceae bacterium]
MRIQLNCDHKWRDWAVLSLLKFILENKYNHEVFLVSRNDRDKAEDVFSPHCIVIPHVNGTSQLEYVKSQKSKSKLVVVLPTEGRPIYKELLDYFYGDYTDYNDIDLFLSWNYPITSGIIDKKKIATSKIRTIGCPRFDFYSSKYNKTVLNKVDFSNKYNLELNKPIVTWATQYNYARFHMSENDWGVNDLIKNGVGDCFNKHGYNIGDFPKDQYHERNDALEAFLSVASEKPEINFIIKPHPAEDSSFYKEIIKKNNLKNITFIYHEHIWNILNNSNIHLQRHCTTGIEAWLLEKPTVEMEMGNSHPFIWKEMSNGSEIAKSKSHLGSIIDYYLEGGEIPKKIINSRKEYLERWFYKVDGNRTLEAAFEINNLLSKNQRKIKWNFERKVNYQIANHFNLNWRDFSIRKPFKLKKEIQYEKHNEDYINIVDRYITQFDVKAFIKELEKSNNESRIL